MNPNMKLRASSSSSVNRNIQEEKREPCWTSEVWLTSICLSFFYWEISLSYTIFTHSLCDEASLRWLWCGDELQILFFFFPKAERGRGKCKKERERQGGQRDREVLGERDRQWKKEMGRKRQAERDRNREMKRERETGCQTHFVHSKYSLLSLSLMWIQKRPKHLPADLEVQSFSLWVAVAAGWEGQSRLSDRFQLFLEDLQMFPSQQWNIISLVDSGSALGSPPSDAAWLGGVLVRCPNHITWIFLIGRSSGSTLSRIVELLTLWDQRPCRGTSFPFPVLVTLFLWTLSPSHDHKWGHGCRLTGKQRTYSFFFFNWISALYWVPSSSPQTSAAAVTVLLLIWSICQSGWCSRWVTAMTGTDSFLSTASCSCLWLRTWLILSIQTPCLSPHSVHGRSPFRGRRSIRFSMKVLSDALKQHERFFWLTLAQYPVHLIHSTVHQMVITSSNCLEHMASILKIWRCNHTLDHWPLAQGALVPSALVSNLVFEKK